MNRGIFIAFEGIDGCGKSTATRVIAERIHASGRACMLTEEPTDGPVGRDIRAVLSGNAPMVAPFELQRLFVLDRKDHIEHVLLPALETGTSVVSDRYWLSTVAYGMLAESSERMIALHRDILGNEFLRPDRTILLDLEPEIALQRMERSRTSLSHFEKLEKLSKIRENYRSLARMDIGAITVIDATMPADAVADAIWQNIGPLLPPPGAH